MSETETILKKKKKKKEFDLKKAVKETLPLVISFRKNKEALIKKCHDVYWELKEFPRDERKEYWDEYCEKIGYHQDYVRSFFKEYPTKYPLWHPEISERLGELHQENLAESEDDILITEEPEPDDVEKMFDTKQYRETYSILKNAQRLTTSMFHINEKDELIKELQTTIKKLNGLLLQLESNIE